MSKVEGRREVILGLSLGAVAALLKPTVVAAAPRSRKLFAGTALAYNPLAAHFEVLPPEIKDPTTLLRTTTGDKRLSDLRSPATLVTIWADFCAGCIMEMPDLARLGDNYRAAGFNVVALHVGGTLQSAMTKLLAINASSIPNWNDPDAIVAKALATPAGETGFTLPCNLLIDSEGHVRGRAFGGQTAEKIKGFGRSLPADAEKRYANAKSAWSLPAADQFAQALGGGLLERIPL